MMIDEVFFFRKPKFFGESRALFFREIIICDTSAYGLQTKIHTISLHHMILCFQEDNGLAIISTEFLCRDVLK